MPHAHPSGFPPRSFDLREKRTPTKAVFRSGRGTARDRPSPYGFRTESMARDRPSPYGERQENSRPDEHFVISRRIADENGQDNTGAIASNRRYLVDTPRVEKVKIALR